MRYSLLLFLLINFYFINAQINVHAVSGSTLGAPIGPIKEGDEGSLQGGPSFGLGISYKVKNYLAFHYELKLSNKKGAYDAYTQGDTVYAFEIPNQPPALFPTTFEGRVKGAFNNAYIDMPFYASFKFKRMRTNIGFYHAILIDGSHEGNVDLTLGENFSQINDEFDDSEFIAPYDFGLLLGGEFYVYPERMSIGMNATYGITSVFKKEYPNIEGHFGNLYAHLFFRMVLY